MIKGRKQIHILRVKFIPLQNGGILYVEGSSTPIKVNESCQTRNCLIFLPYCTNGLYLTTFLGFKFSTNIADSDTYDNLFVTPIYGHIF